MPRNDNINKHLSAAPSFTLKSFPAERSEKETVVGERADEYLITIVLNASPRHTPLTYQLHCYPHFSHTLLKANPWPRCLELTTTNQTECSFPSVFLLDPAWVFLQHSHFFSLFPLLPPQNAFRIHKPECLLQSYYLLWRWFDVEVMAVVITLSLTWLCCFYRSISEGDAKVEDGEGGKQQANRFKILTSDLYSPSLP